MECPKISTRDGNEGQWHGRRCHRSRVRSSDELLEVHILTSAVRKFTAKPSYLLGNTVESIHLCIIIINSNYKQHKIPCLVVVFYTCQKCIGYKIEQWHSLDALKNGVYKSVQMTRLQIAYPSKLGMDGRGM